MKRLLLIISILALVLVPIGCVQSTIQSTIENALAGVSANYTIQVTDTEGFNFTGRYVVVTAQYDPTNYVAISSTPNDVDLENVSKEYTVLNAVEVGAMFQKLSENGTLVVEILKGGVVVASDTTTDPYGAVLVTAP